MFLNNLLFPKFCLGCGYLGSYICKKCQKNLYFVTNDKCVYCGRASLYGFTHPGCRRKNGLDGAMSIFYYNNLMKAVIKSIKYRFALEVWKEFCLVIKPEVLGKVGVFKTLKQVSPTLEPIPLHPTRLRLRGFNQAKIIAEFFSQFLPFSLSSHLVRVKNTFPQARLEKPGDRFSNVRRAFRVNSSSRVKLNNVILVDDVVTSGSTLKEATRVLKESGAEGVFALTIAQG